jgi:hypothetical protein
LAATKRDLAHPINRTPPGLCPGRVGGLGIWLADRSRLAALTGFLREGLRGLLHLPARPVEMNVKIIPSAFEPLPESASKDAN